MSAAIERLARALEFLDACRAEAGAVEVGAMRDAHEWLEDAARKAVAELREPARAQYSDLISDGGMDPRDRAAANPSPGSPGIVDSASKQHHCTPPQPWRPTKQ